MTEDHIAATIASRLDDQQGEPILPHHHLCTFESNQ
jgi:hypothetical protein